MGLFIKLSIKLIFTLLVFSVCRLVLFSMYNDDIFSTLSLWQIFVSFFWGIKFDLSVVLTFFSLPILMLSLPHRIFENQRWTQFWNWLLITVFSLMLSLCVGDIIYFGQVQRHVFDELLLIGNDLSMFVDLIWSAYLLIFFVVIGFCVLVGYLWRWIDRFPLRSSQRRIQVFFLIVLLTAMGIRGTFSAKAINIVDAFVSGDTAQGHLILNGAFSAWHASRNSKNVSVKFFEDEELNAILSPMGFDSNKEFPFVKDSEPGLPQLDGKKPNIVVLLLESWGAYYVDSFDENRFGATPNFDRLSADGLLFTNFYAHGSRSIEAIQAILTSFPALKGLPTIGLGFELLRVPKMGKIFSDRGYETLFFQSADRRSMRLDSIARSLGFSRYFGREDYPSVLDYRGESSPQFGWDYEALMHMYSTLKDTKGPFVSFLFSGTTHTPFRKPPELFRAEGHGSENEVGFLNTLHYSDWALGRFIEKARETKWFDNTVFIITADHMLTAYRKFDFLESHNIPLLIYAPKLLGAGVVDVIGSHVDILPTLLHLSGVQEQTASLGRSLLLPRDEEYALISGRFASPAIIVPNTYLVHNLKQRLESYSVDPGCDETCFETLEHRLLGIYQLLFKTIKENRCIPK